MAHPLVNYIVAEENIHDMSANPKYNNTHRSIRDGVNKNICRMHIRKMKALSDIVDTLPVMIIHKAFPWATISPYSD